MSHAEASSGEPASQREVLPDDARLPLGDLCRRKRSFCGVGSGQAALGPLRPFANLCLPRGGKAREPGLRASLWLAWSGSMHCAGRDHRAGDSAHVLRAGLCPSLPLDFAASPARRSRWLACRGRCRSPLARRIATAGRAAQRSKGGDVGRRPASGDMSAAARPVGPILYSPDAQGRSLRTAAMGRKHMFAQRGFSSPYCAFKGVRPSGC